LADSLVFRVEICFSIDSYPHFLHQEASIHVLGNAFSQFVGESQLIMLNVCFEAVIADFVGEMLYQVTQQEVVCGDDSIRLQLEKLFDERERAFLLVHGIGAFQNRRIQLANAIEF
jgi:hypothetical protein